MVEKPKRFLQVIDLMGENLSASPWWAKRQKKFIEDIERERKRLKALLEGRGYIPKMEEKKDE